MDVIGSFVRAHRFPQGHIHRYVRRGILAAKGARAHIEDWDIRSAVVRANKAAGFTIGKMGSQADVPWADEIDRFEAPLHDP